MKGAGMVPRLLMLALSAALWCQASRVRSWEEWKARHGKAYDTDEDDMEAYTAWLRNTEYVTDHNSRPHVTFSVEVNQFGDKNFNLTRNAQPNTKSTTILRFLSRQLAPAVEVPASWDWRTKGVVSPVQNQGAMGSAEAIAVTEDLASALAITSGSLKNLSVQEVVDCCSQTPGLLDPNVYRCIFQRGGLCTASAYPHSSGSCKSRQCTGVPDPFPTTTFVAKGNETALQLAVLKMPLVVYVDASHASFQLYKGGVYSDPACGSTIDHTMQLVGYGTLQGQPYWILKNSWGASWGMKGYMLMERGRNMCGVADMAKYPS